jgi:multicomponent Na+:H+ antiporter subunit F
MSETLEFVLRVSLAIHVILLVICVFFMHIKKHPINRLIGLDMVSSLSIAILVLLGIIITQERFLDVALTMAALSCVGVVALSRYLAEGEDLIDE